MDYNYHPETPAPQPSEKEIEQRQNAITAMAARLGSQLSMVISEHIAFSLMLFDPRYEGVRTINCDGPVEPMLKNLRFFVEKLEANKGEIERHRLEDLAKIEIAQAQAEAAHSTKQ